jgi:hypothetical protein
MALEDAPGEGLTADATLQVLTERFGVIVAMSNAADYRGQASTEALDDIKAELLAALLGFEADADHVAMEYAGGRHLAMNRARLWHQFDFVTQVVISTL